VDLNSGQVIPDIASFVDSGTNLRGQPAEVPMRDWLMILVPAAVFVYLVAYPEKGQEFIHWAEALLR